MFIFDYNKEKRKYDIYVVVCYVIEVNTPSEIRGEALRRTVTQAFLPEGVAS